MISEPDISRDELITLLEESYDIKITKLTFLPKGEASWGYVVETDEEKYFFKIYKLHVSDSPFKFTRDIHDKCAITNVIFPKTTLAGDLKITVMKHSGILFNYVDGKTEKEIGLDKNRLIQLGELFAKVHQSKNIIGPLDSRETFDNKDVDDFNKVISFTNPTDPMKEKTYNLLQSNLRALKSLLETLKETETDLKNEKIDFVNCHGDPTQENILITRDEKIFLIDWDEPIFAPKEKDLLFFTGTDRLPYIMEGYKKITGTFSLNEKVIVYYDLSWKVQEVADFGTRLLFEDHPETQQEHNFDRLKEELQGIASRFT